MNLLRIHTLLLICLCLISCDKDDDGSENTTELEIALISFADSAGNLLQNGACIDPSKPYTIVIETSANGSAATKSMAVDFTVNGILYNMTFSSRGKQKVTVDLKTGENIAQISGTSLTARIYMVEPAVFEELD